MQFLKPFISLFLLLTYTVGFAQGLTSVCNHFPVAEEKTDTSDFHDHQHHVHDGNELGNHDHVQHQDHFDENTFDLLLCVLEDVSHQPDAPDGCHCVPTDNTRASTNWITKIKLLAVLVPHFIVLSTEEATVEYASSEEIGIISDFYSESRSQRGPPTIS